jgi:Flp pilus assembly pilin Flp
MRSYVLLVIIAVLTAAVFALLGMWVQIGDALRDAFLKI